MKIALLCPTRKRPENIKRFVEAAYDQATEPQNLFVSFYVDEDDEESVKAIKNLMRSISINIFYMVGPRIVLSNTWNKCYKNVKDYAEIFHQSGDDLVFRTFGWDTEIREKFRQFPDRICAVFGRDLHCPPHFGSHVYVHKNWIETVGRFTAPYFVSNWSDEWLNDVADALDRKIPANILHEHMHPRVGKAEWDQTHMDRRQREDAIGLDILKKLYYSYEPERLEEISKLRKFIEEFKQ